MYHWTEEALITDVAHYGDRDALVQLFTPTHGLCRGIVKRGMESKQRADLQAATLAHATWKARLPEHMGTITLEGAQGFAPRVMHDPLRLAGIASGLGLLNLSLAERDPHPLLYARLVDFLRHVAAGVEARVWLAEYARLELFLLEQTGFGLDLSECAATGTTEDLIYVSPKSGRAVSRVAGAPYQDRMLRLPAFLLHEDAFPESISDIQEALQLTGYFFEHRLLPALHRHTPPMRGHFLALLEKIRREE